MYHNHTNAQSSQSSSRDLGQGILFYCNKLNSCIHGRHGIIAENRPYWYDIESQLAEIWELVDGIEVALNEAINIQDNDQGTNDLAREFTGVDLVRENVDKNV